jgi:guanylate kinase
MIKNGDFLEYADVFGNYYGTAKHYLEKAKQSKHDLLLDIDVQGAAQIKHKIPEAVSIFILPPNRTELESRLRDRGQDSEAVIHRRLATATREIENYPKYDYILVNDRLDDSIQALQSILLAERLKHSGVREQRSAEDDNMLARAERCRLNNVRERLQPILASFATTAAR